MILRSEAKQLKKITLSPPPWEGVSRKGPPGRAPGGNASKGDHVTRRSLYWVEKNRNPVGEKVIAEKRQNRSSRQKKKTIYLIRVYTNPNAVRQ